MSYTERLGSNSVIRDTDGMIIGPENETEWAEYQVWIDEGNILNPATDDLRIVSDTMRNQRNSLLAETDWTQGKDISSIVSDKWATYRQQLRDVPEQPGFPMNIEWPNKPK